jgi:hypothetical protein
MSDILGDGERLLDKLNRQDCERARTKITSAPLTLTDHDFVLLHNYGGEGEAAKAYEARRLAQLAIVREHQPAPLATKGDAKPAAPPATSAEWLQRWGKKPVTYKQLSRELDDLIDVLKSHKAKLDTLTQENTELRGRVLELEASEAAARTVEHVDR